MTDGPRRRRGGSARLRRTHRALLQATVEVARGIFHARAASAPLRRRDGRARLRGGRRRGVGHADRRAPPVEHGHRRLGLVTRQAIVLDDVSQDPRRGGREIADKTGYVPKGLMASADPRGGGSASSMSSTGRRSRGSRSRRWSCWGSSESGGDRARSAPESRRAKAVLDGTATPRSSRGSRRISTRSTGSAAPPASSCSARWRPSSSTEAGLSPASATLEMRLRQSI